MDLVFTPGKRLMGLTKPELMTLVNNKIGPCLKMENLLSLLKVFIYYFILWLNVVHLDRGHLGHHIYQCKKFRYFYHASNT